MDNLTKPAYEAALGAIASMTDRSEKAQVKFVEGSSQHTLQKNRIKALYIAAALIRKAMGEQDAAKDYTKEDFVKAIAPTASLISKSGKARDKLAEGSWQRAMLEGNLKALHIALPLVKAAAGAAEE